MLDFYFSYDTSVQIAWNMRNKDQNDDQPHWMPLIKSNPNSYILHPPMFETKGIPWPDHEVHRSSPLLAQRIVVAVNNMDCNVWDLLVFHWLWVYNGCTVYIYNVMMYWCQIPTISTIRDAQASVAQFSVSQVLGTPIRLHAFRMKCKLAAPGTIAWKEKWRRGGALYQFLFDSTQYLFLSSCDNRMQGYVEAAPAVDGASFEGNSGTHSPWMIQLLSDVLADELKFFFQTGKDDHQPPAKLAGVGPASSTGHDCRDEDHLRKKGCLKSGRG